MWLTRRRRATLDAEMPQGGKVAHKGEKMPQGGKVAQGEPQWQDIDKVKFDQIYWIGCGKDVNIQWRPSGDDIDFEYDESDVKNLEKCLASMGRLADGSELPDGSEMKIPISGGRYWAIFGLLDGKLSVRQVNAAEGQDWKKRHMERSAVHVG